MRVFVHGDEGPSFPIEALSVAIVNKIFKLFHAPVGLFDGLEFVYGEDRGTFELIESIECCGCTVFSESILDPIEKIIGRDVDGRGIVGKAFVYSNNKGSGFSTAV